MTYHWGLFSPTRRWKEEVSLCHLWIKALTMPLFVDMYHASYKPLSLDLPTYPFIVGWVGWGITLPPWLTSFKTALGSSIHTCLVVCSLYDWSNIKSLEPSPNRGLIIQSIIDICAYAPGCGCVCASTSVSWGCCYHWANSASWRVDAITNRCLCFSAFACYNIKQIIY